MIQAEKDAQRLGFHHTACSGHRHAEHCLPPCSQHSPGRGRQRPDTTVPPTELPFNTYYRLAVDTWGHQLCHPARGATIMYKYVIDNQGKRMEQLKHSEERELEMQGRRGINCCEWPASLSGAMVSSQPDLSLRATSGFLATILRGYCQCSWFILLLESMKTSLVGVATRDHLDVQGLCITCPGLLLLQHSVELTPSHQPQQMEERALHLAQGRQWN